MLGHTHQPFTVRVHDTLFINPGAVGRSLDRDVRATCAVLDTRTHNVDFHRVEYDVDSAAQSILASGMPDGIATLLRYGMRRIEEAEIA